MPRFLWMIAALVAFLSLGGPAQSWPFFTSSSYRPQSKVFEGFPGGSDDGWQKQYAFLIDPGFESIGSLQAGLTKSIHLNGIGLPEPRIVEGFDMLRQNLLKLILENKGKVVGEPRLTLVRGYLQGFEIDYVQASLKGSIRGTLTPGKKPGTWNIECEMNEENADKKNRFWNW